MKRYIIAVCLFLILLFLFPSYCVEGAKNGLLLWFNTIIPSIFPFILMTALLRSFGGIQYMEKLFGSFLSKVFLCSKHGAYAVIIGLICGYPLGAKAVADSYDFGYIDRKEADYLLTFCCLPSPMYLYNYVLSACIGHKELAPAFYASVYIAAWMTCMISYRFYYSKHLTKTSKIRIYTMDYSPDQLLEQCIDDALLTIQKIGVYMILFSILSHLIFALPDRINSLKIILTGLCEQTTGIDALCKTQISLASKTVLTAVFTSFGGFAVAAQTHGVISSHGLSVKPYISGKIIHAVITGLLTAVFFQIQNLFFPC